MIDLKAIEEAARAATPGPWRHNKDNEQIGDVCQPDGWTVATTQPQPIPKGQQHIQRDRDARHISLCDPQTVLKLVEIARAARAYWDHIDEFRQLVTSGIRSEEDHERFQRIRSDHSTEEALRAALKDVEV